MLEKALPGIGTKICFTLLILFTTNSYGQLSHPGYWALDEIKHAKNKLMHGATLAYMEGIADKYPYLINQDDRLELPYPTKRLVTFANFLSFTDQRLRGVDNTSNMGGQLIDSIISIQALDSVLSINFLYRGTAGGPQQFVAIYRSISSNEYKLTSEADSLAEAEREIAINRFVDQYKGRHALVPDNPPSILNKIELKGRSSKINLHLPSDYTIQPSGEILVERFGKVKVGTFAENDFYTIRDNVSGNALASCFVFKVTQFKPDLQEYLTRNELKIITSDSMGVFAVLPKFNAELKQLQIESYVILRLLTKGANVVLLLADTTEEDIAVRQYQLLEQINIL